MDKTREFGPSIALDILKLKNGNVTRATENVATEIPLTININEKEIATILCSPINLKELAYGFLFTSGFMKSTKEVHSFSLDTTKWVAEIAMEKPPDPSLMQKRLYTSGCGKGIMYTSINEIAYRKPIENSLTISSEQITATAQWLQHCSELFRSTGSVHTAALSIQGETPQIYFDDVGRHNAVDKVIGRALMHEIDFSQTIVISSGRTSSEILHKVRTGEIAILISRGAPTHQTVLRARDMGITVIGFARGGNFTIYSHEKRVLFK